MLLLESSKPTDFQIPSADRKSAKSFGWGERGRERGGCMHRTQRERAVYVECIKLLLTFISPCIASKYMPWLCQIKILRQADFCVGVSRPAFYCCKTPSGIQMSCNGTVKQRQLEFL